MLRRLSDAQDPAHVRAVAHKAWLRDLFRDLHAGTPFDDPDAVADQLSLIADGMYGSVQALGTTGPAGHGPACGAMLLDAADLPSTQVGGLA